jgi:hypothetical protein
MGTLAVFLLCVVSSGAQGLDVAPRSLSFGVVEVGKTAARSVTLRAQGTTTVRVRGVGLGGPNPQAFAITAGGVGTVRAGETLNVDLTFAPVASGRFQALLVINSDAADALEIVVPLEGEARKGQCEGCVAGPIEGPGHAPVCREDDAAFCTRLRKNCGEVDAIDACGKMRHARCWPSPTGDDRNNALVFRVPDECMDDSGRSVAGDSLEVYCHEGVIRFCLSGEQCPWRDGGGLSTRGTCSASGLTAPWMARIFPQPRCRELLHAASVCCYADPADPGLGRAMVTQAACPAAPHP